MAQSSEYPDLPWMPPRSWTNANRTAVQVVVIHDTEGSEGVRSAEDGAVNDQHRTDGTSTHYFHDQDSTVQCVLTADIAHAARANGNRIGIQHELCGRAGQGAAGWADPASKGTLWQAARQVARDCRKWGIPARRLTPAQVAAGTKGICGHADITAAFPADKGDHTDPGPTFPWAAFLALVQDFLDGDEMDLTPQNLTDIARAVWAQPVGTTGISAHNTLFGPMQANLAKAAVTTDAVLKNVVADDGDRAQLLSAIQAERAELLAAVGQIDDELLAKLGNPQTPDAQVAAALVSLLGPRKNAVLALIQG